MLRLSREMLPSLLEEVCDVSSRDALSIGEDILARAEDFAALDQRTRDVLIAPFVEEVIDHEPAGDEPDLKAAVTVVVRNSALETVHASGLVNEGGIR